MARRSLASLRCILGSLHLRLPSNKPPEHMLVQKHFMSTPRIILKPDRSLDAITERDKKLRPIFKIRDLILRQQTQTIRIRYLEIKRGVLGLKMKEMSVRAFLKRYPNIFVVYQNTRDNQLWCRLTKEIMNLLEEEEQIYRDQEAQIVERMKRLLMMAKDRRLRVGKLEFARPVLGLPDDFANRLVSGYPQFFRLVGEDPSPYLELVDWDESLATSELEKRAKEDARKAGLGEIETRGQPLPFKVSFSPGMMLRRKNLELLAEWQKLPYVSPYEDWSWVKSGTAQSDKRIVALLHEILCLTVEKKFLVGVIGRFRDEFGLPQSVAKLFHRYPGIFYLSLKGGAKTILLREGYEKSKLIEDHPIVHLKAKYMDMVLEGPRLRFAQSTAKNDLGDGNDATEGDGESQEEIDEGELEAEDMPDDPVDSEDYGSGGDDGGDDGCDDDYDEEDNERRRSSKNASSRIKKEIW